jgi:hypothetical protein
MWRRVHPITLYANGLRTQHHISGKTTFRTGLPPWVFNEEAHRQLLVHDQASGTRSPGSESGTCVALPCSPRSSPLAPPAPRLVAQVCSPASLLLWKGLTSPARSSSASTPHLPDTDRSTTSEAAKQEISRFPCKERTCMPGSKTTQGRTGTRAIAPIRVAFRYANSVGTLN